MIKRIKFFLKHVVLPLLILAGGLILGALALSSNDQARCPDCYGKMKTRGKWVCLECDGEFKHGKGKRLI